MKKLTLTNQVQNDTTVLENEFIDSYMAAANGEYVKVYLLLLRHLNDPSGTLTVPKIADLLDLTERDVVRALNYWKKQGILDYDSHTADEAAARTSETAVAEHLASERLNPGTAAAPISSTESPAIAAAITSVGSAMRAATAAGTAQILKSAPKAASNMEQYRARKEFKELLFVAEQYLGKTLSRSDVETITYFYETLQMSADLIEYLIEYCVENGHKSIHYIQKVALSWHERQVKTVSEAKAGSALYNKTCYSVLNAFGIKGRAPAPSELAYIRRWTGEYAFSLDLILNACARTINATHQPSFDYAESILKRWYEHQVKTLKDVEILDTGYMREKERAQKQASSASAKPTQNGSKFNNFENRSYDMNELERRLVQQ